MNKFGCIVLLAFVYACVPAKEELDSKSSFDCPDASVNEHDASVKFVFEAGKNSAIDTGVVYDSNPEIEIVSPVLLPLPGAIERPEVTGFSVNTRIHPKGEACEWYVEYGPTEAYGSFTTSRSLPGKLAAYYLEDWNHNDLAGYQGSITGTQLSYDSSDKFVRYTAQGDSSGDDANHTSGIGVIQLPIYFYTGNFEVTVPMTRLGGNGPDLRGAKISAKMRGESWNPAGTKLSPWVQVAVDTDHWSTSVPQFANWAFTSCDVTTSVLTGKWENVSWQLSDRTDKWTYAGRNPTHFYQRYFYKELDKTLAFISADMFPVMNIGIDWPNTWPSGSIDFDDFQIVYRQHNLCAESNGGKLLSGGDHTLTDGWRNGVGREWSVANSNNPQEIVYSFERPVSVYSLQIHNAQQYPSKDIEVSVSDDSGHSWHVIASGTLPQSMPSGPNFVYYFADNKNYNTAKYDPMYPTAVNRVRVRILSGYQDEAWGLGEIEVYGTGSVEKTDNDWYELNQDVEVAPGEYHYRVIAISTLGTTVGPDQFVVVK